MGGPPLTVKRVKYQLVIILRSGGPRSLQKPLPYHSLAQVHQPMLTGFLDQPRLSQTLTLGLSSVIGGFHPGFISVPFNPTSSSKCCQKSSVATLWPVRDPIVPTSPRFQAAVSSSVIEATYAGVIPQLLGGILQVSDAAFLGVWNDITPSPVKRWSD